MRPCSMAQCSTGCKKRGLGTGDWGVLAPRGRSRCTVLGVTAETTNRHSRERGNPATLLPLGRKDASGHSSQDRRLRVSPSPTPVPNPQSPVPRPPYPLPRPPAPPPHPPPPPTPPPHLRPPPPSPVLHADHSARLRVA